MPVVYNALSQVCYLVIFVFLFIVAVEFVLWWMLYRYKTPSFFAALLLAGGIFSYILLPKGATDTMMMNYLLGGIVGALGIGAVFKYVVKGAYKIAMMMLAPAFIVICAVVIYPFFFELRLSFADLNLYTINGWLSGTPLSWVGFKNFINVFTQSPLQTVGFFGLFFRTIIWTVINVIFHVGFGVILALLLNKSIRFKGIYRTILIIPWAVPQVVIVLALRGEFHPQFGVFNQILAMFGIPAISWWSDPTAVFASCCFVNIWLGIPFMMIVLLGGLQAIPKSYYEAASIDGASSWQQFWKITVPLLRPVVVPSVTLGTIWTFNNINVIYLMTGQSGGNEFADILVSALYKSAFTYSKYSYAAAFSIVIFAILVVITTCWIKFSKGADSVAN